MKKETYTIEDGNRFLITDKNKTDFGIRGDISGVWGDISGLRGDLSGV